MPDAMSEKLFFIALVPPEPISREVEAFKQLARERFHSERALRSPAHITLFPPFFWQETKSGLLKEVLKEFAAEQFPFEVELRHFACFKPRVIFIHPLLSPSFEHLHTALALRLEDRLGLFSEDKRSFHPHMTIAFKDLKREVFPEAWAYFGKISYHRTFLADRLALLNHRSHNWEIDEVYAFEGVGEEKTR